eukprot:7385572-Prymnesium_polylepis.1
MGSANRVGRSLRIEAFSLTLRSMRCITTGFCTRPAATRSDAAQRRRNDGLCVRVGGVQSLHGVGKPGRS